MKKIVAGLIALTLSAALFTGCLSESARQIQETEESLASAETAKEDKTVEKTEESEETTEEETTTEETTPVQTTVAETTTASTTADETTVAAGAANTTVAASSNGAASIKYEDTRIYKLASDIKDAMSVKKYAYKMTMNHNGETSVISLYQSGSKYRMDMNGVSEGQKINMTIIINGGTTYMLDNETKTGISTKSSDTSTLDDELDMVIGEDENYTNITSEKVVFEGKECICETFGSGSDMTKFYFTDGVSNKVIVVDSGDRIELELLSAPSDSIFGVPSGYTVNQLSQ